MRLTRATIVVLLAVLAVSPGALAADPEVSLPERAAEKLYVDGKLPSLALAVVTDRAVPLVRCWGVADRETGAPATPQTLYEIGSVTKPMTAAVALSLRDEARLALDDPASRYLPAGTTLPADPRGPAITLRHLLTHASGLPRNPVSMPGDAADPWKGLTRDLMLGGLAETRLQSVPGDRYDYSNLGYALLGVAIEKASGRPFEAALQERLLRPLGMTSTLVDPAKDTAGLAVPYDEKDTTMRGSRWAFDASAPAGGVVSSLDDMARFVAWQLRAGSGGASPLAAGSVREMQEPQRMAPDWTFGVGLGWHVGRAGTIGAYPWHSGMTGGYTCAVAFSPRFRTGVVLMTNAATPALTQGVGEVLLKAVQVYGAERPPEVPPEVEALVSRLEAGLVATPPLSLAAEFSPEFLRSVPFEKIAVSLASLHAIHGPCVGHRFERPDFEWPYRVVFKMADGKERPCHLAVDAGRRPRITGLLFLQ